MTDEYRKYQLGEFPNLTCDIAKKYISSTNTAILLICRIANPGKTVIILIGTDNAAKIGISAQFSLS